MTGNQNCPLPRRLGLLWVALICLGLFQLTGQLAFGQIDQGSIVGIIQDSSGAVVPNATIALTNTDNGLVLQTHSDTSGGYTFSPVRIGNYQVSATASGFSTTQQSLKVEVQQHVVANLQLKPGAATETVEVTSAVPVLETQDASVGQVVNARNVNNLPLNGRNFTFLAQLAAGVNSPQADTRGNAASGAFAANGLRPAQNNYMLDGIDNNSDTVDFLNGTNFVVLPPVDAIQEFKVQTSDFSAEFGRSGAAVLNATIKSGTNSFHGAVWEFFRNNKLDAADYFERDVLAGGQTLTRKGQLNLNQFGASIGGPVIRNKIFFFGDYEGLRRRQGSPHTGNVPTVAERSSGYTNFQDLITGQSGTTTDALGRTMPQGTILDPATTRPVAGGFVRDPFLGPASTCTAATTVFTLAACDLNILPLGRLDLNAIKLLNLYPAPTSGSLFQNFTTSPAISENRNAFDTRVDLNFNDKNQVFYRFSFVDDPIFIPSNFGGVADGGGFQEGSQTALAQQSALAWTHVFSPSLVNVAHAGLNYLHTTRTSPAADAKDVPAQFGILGVPQESRNGGLPYFNINGLSSLGAFAFLPSDEVSSTFQVTDDFTKIYGNHTFKMGFEFQHVKFSTLQPSWSRGVFQFDGIYTDVPNVGGGNTGRAGFLLTPIAAQNGGTVDFVGGPNTVYLSNISLTDNGKNYYGTYFQDDWKVTPKLTVNLGLRWDFFGLVFEHHGNQANFVPGGPPTGGPMYLIPNGPNSGNLSSGCATCFTNLLAQDGIALQVGNKYGKGLGRSQKTNFAPRVGFAYQATPKLVARAGFGLFYNGFENRGYSPNLGENYPFQFDFRFFNPDQNHSINNFAGCPTATPAGGPTLETGFSCTPLSPLIVNASGLSLRGIQFDYITPYSMSGNFTVQYQLTNSMSLQVGYVTSLGRHLEVFPNANNVTAILPASADRTKVPAAQGGLQFPDFGAGTSYAITAGSSHYHGLQAKLEKHFAAGLNFLATYTWSQARSDAHDLLNAGSVNTSGGSNQNGYRAPSIPGFGIEGDYGLAPFDIRHVVHLSGGYELPFGKNKRFLANSGGLANVVAGGWSVNWAATLQGGQPVTIPCSTNPASAGTACNAILIGNADTGLHIDSNRQLSFLKNPAAFNQPCVLGGAVGATVPIANQPTGCIPLNGLDSLGGGPGQFAGPGFRRLDFSIFKDFLIGERFRLQFRSEFFNILNHPNFNAPGFGGNGVIAIPGSTDFKSSNFGEIGSTRGAPYDPRQIQFALKLYY